MANNDQLPWLVTQHAPRFQHTMLYGRPLLSLSVNDLRAAVVQAYGVIEARRNEHLRQLDTLFGVQ